jgi:hypothetical protein
MIVLRGQSNRRLTHFHRRGNRDFSGRHLTRCAYWQDACGSQEQHRKPEHESDIPAFEQKTPHMAYSREETEKTAPALSGGRLFDACDA